MTGDVDVMISIRSNFFYTRTVPCELWHFDRGKPNERRDQVLMRPSRLMQFQPREQRRTIFSFMALISRSGDDYEMEVEAPGRPDRR